MGEYSAAVERHMVQLYGSLSEKDRRRYAAVEAEKLGHGGVQYIADLFDCDPDTNSAWSRRYGALARGRGRRPRPKKRGAERKLALRSQHSCQRLSRRWSRISRGRPSRKACSGRIDPRQTWP